MDREEEQRQAEEQKADGARRKKAGALAAVFAGSMLAQLAAMVFGKGKKKEK